MKTLRKRATKQELSHLKIRRQENYNLLSQHYHHQQQEQEQGTKILCDLYNRHDLTISKSHHYYHRSKMPPNIINIFTPNFSSTLFLLFLSAFILSICQTPVAQANPSIASPKSFNNSTVHEIVRNTVNNNNNNNNNNYNNNINTEQHEPATPLAEAKRKFVLLSNNTGLNVRSLNHGSSLYFSPLNNRHNLSSDLSTSKLSDNQQTSQQKKNTFEKICIGTSNRMSGQHNKTDHYQNLVERYRNCTHVTGNLEITWLEKSIDGKPLDLTFLESIREITGYLLIAYVEVEEIKMPNLQIIRGRDFFKLNNNNEEFAMFLIQNQLRNLELPNLREILAGSVGFYNNQKLCHIRTINWDEILNGPMYRSIFVYDVVHEPQCPQCHDSCQGGCWGEGPEMCQKFSKTNCSPQCSQGRCFGSLPRECCHLFCAGGCTGPRQTDCIACKNFSDDGECIQECPSMQRYNPTKYVWEANPSGKYAFGANCVKECPDHLLRDNGACVRTCPPNKRSVNGECVPCGGPCPKNCQGVEVVHSGNINQLINCTVIEGSISILDTSFTGYAEVYSNNTIGTRYKEMHPTRLDVFKTVKEITGFLNIQATHSDFKDLSYFKNLEIIGGRQMMDMMYTLSVIRTSLVELNLHSLKKVRSGKILIEENKELCFTDTIDWSKINLVKREDITTRNNAEPSKCRKLGLKCHDQCTKDGCWGPGPDECISCNKYKLGDYCVDNCTSIQVNGILSYDSGNNTCKKCHSECKDGCNGTEAKDCFSCKNVKDGPYCVPECPSHKYNHHGICKECDKSCIDGCTGPSNKLGEGGCNSCSKAIINLTDPIFVGHCIKAEQPCPEGYYQEYIAPLTEGPLKSSSGKPVCRKCHHRCKSCTGMGAHVSVCECAKYVAGEHCEDYCPRDYFADESLKRCMKCSPECNGCFGPTEADCISCKVYRIYHNSHSNPIASAHISDTNKFNLDNSVTKLQNKFNCTGHCPANKPHRISERNMLDPYCSEHPENGSENPLVDSLSSFTWIYAISILLIVLCCILLAYGRKKCEHDNKTLKLSMHLSGIDSGEPLNPSNLKPNLAPLRSIKETELRKGKVLGSGFGGTVYQGVWHPEGQEHKKQIPVAIKVLHDNGQSNMTKEFLDEAFIMASVNHPNLVRLLAVCTTPNHQMLITQLMPLGCLLEHVKKCKNEIGSKSLLEWCKQIANGMAYLEENRMVHRDLALRNVLLQTTGKALISDFGLAKFLEVNQSEYHSGGGRLPIKWLAPECIRERKFTHKSDIWAFGVTVWELLTLGMRPFEEYDTKDVPMAIEKGARLQQPSYVSTEVYKVMYSCWFYNPDDRPNFKSLAQNFVNFARDPDRYISGKKVIQDYNQTFGKGSDSDENEFEDHDSEVNSSNGDDNQQRSVIPDLLKLPSQIRQGLPDLVTSSNSSRINESTPLFEFRNHSESSENGNSKHVSTPTLKMTGMFQGAGQQLVEDVFLPNSHNHPANKTSLNQVTDLNNNNNSTPNGRTNIHSGSCWSMHHTVSTTSLGQKSSELPLDHDEYLLPSPCSNEDKFSKFIASREGPSGNLPPAPPFARDPPHSAGLIGISNDEYFLTWTNYANSNRSHGATNASSGHIPHSLV